MPHPTTNEGSPHFVWGPEASTPPPTMPHPTMRKWGQPSFPLSETQEWHTCWYVVVVVDCTTLLRSCMYVLCPSSRSCFLISSLSLSVSPSSTMPWVWNNAGEEHKHGWVFQAWRASIDKIPMPRAHHSRLRKKTNSTALLFCWWSLGAQANISMINLCSNLTLISKIAMPCCSCCW